MDLVEKYIGEGSPLEDSKKREEAISNAILKFAKKYKIGPLDTHKHRYIDSMGNITMLQKMKGSIDYVQDEGIPEKVQKMALKYAGGYGSVPTGGVSGRWIKLNHFTWEKMLKKEGFLK